MTGTPSAMIEVDDLRMYFGGIYAVDGASIRIAKGSITGLIGPNGAGKSTLFNVVAGHYQPTSGTVRLDGEDITADDSRRKKDRMRSDGRELE